MGFGVKLGSVCGRGYENIDSLTSSSYTGGGGGGEGVVCWGMLLIDGGVE